MTVRALFFNTPARRKFLRSTRSEVRACQEAATVLALTLPGLGMTLLADGRALVEALPAPGLPERVAQLFGERFASTLLPVAATDGAVRVRGLVQRPAEASPSGRVAYLLVNGRPFRDPFLIRAAERGYRGTVPVGARPSVILALEVPAADLDVNVHPAKLEVRFRDRFAVEAAVEAAVHAALGPLAASAPLVAGSALPWEHRAAPARAPAAVHDLFGADAQGGEAVGDDAGEGDGGTDAVAVRVVAQLHGTYILAEVGDGLLIVDQHSAHERVLYERAMAVLTGGGAAAQKLLFPLTITLGPDEHDAVEAHGDLLAALGYEVEAFGPSAIIVHATPAPHPRFDAERCLREVLADVAGGRFGGLHNRLERFASTFACRAAIKAGQPLTHPEMTELVQRLLTAALPAHDVHGRPTIVQLPLAELHRRFGRH